MINLAALDLEPSALDHPIDADGLVIPDFWRPAPDRWMRQALSVRQKLSAAYLEDERRKAEKAATLVLKAPRAGGKTGPPFTTDYAIKWMRRQKQPNGRPWTLIDRERFDFKTKRHADLQLGMDLLCDDGQDGMVGIQAAGKSERAEHYRRFMDRGGPDKAKRRHIRVFYMEFVRGNPNPILMEQWA